MDIRRITYRRTRNLGNYENETLEVTADVSYGETPEQTARDLKAWVREHLAVEDPPARPAPPRPIGRPLPIPPPPPTATPKDGLPF